MEVLKNQGKYKKMAKMGKEGFSRI
jgi:hypothetical protein